MYAQVQEKINPDMSVQQVDFATLVWKYGDTFTFAHFVLPTENKGEEYKDVTVFCAFKKVLKTKFAH